jgi:polysaccharide export outer membrane protein
MVAIHREQRRCVAWQDEAGKERPSEREGKTVSRKNKPSSSNFNIIGLMALLALPAVLAGCNFKSFLWDPSSLGRFEKTRLTLPIRDSLDIGEVDSTQWADTTPIEPGDLIAPTGEYKIGIGDILSVSVFELLTQNVETTHTRRVDATGTVRLPVIGKVAMAGHTPSELERTIADRVQKMGLVTDPPVSVIVQTSQHQTFSVLSDGAGMTGTFELPRNDYRILDAMTKSEGTAGQINAIYVIRLIEQPEVDPAESGADAVEQLEQILNLRSEPEADAGNDAAPDKEVSTPGSATSQPGSRKWVKKPTDAAGWTAADAARQDEQLADDEQETLLPPVPRRIIFIPYDKLLAGDLSYNIVIRPGDILRIPAPPSGNVYVGGKIGSGGSFALPGERTLTFKQIIHAAGGFGPDAMPQRIELIRRIDADHEVYVHIDGAALFRGDLPDFYLKPHDTINVGTSALHPILTAVRNGFRFSYGAGFIFDRNFFTGNDSNR